MADTSTSKGGAGGGKTRRRRNERAVVLRRWLARVRPRELGRELTMPELVHELHVCRRLPLPEVAEVLGVSVKAVLEHCPKRSETGAVRAPQSEADLLGLREQISVALWETVTATYSEVTPDAEKEGEAGPPAPPKPPMLSVRIRALKEIAKLYDVGRKTRDSGVVHVPYATPEEIAALVRERLLEMRGEGRMRMNLA